MRYVHFTDDEGADQIIASGELKASSIVDGVFAVAEGGSYSPSVQQTKLGRPKNRIMAVVFNTNQLPDVAFPEEVIWHLPVLPIFGATKMTADEASQILDDSTPITQDGWLSIPIHPSVVDKRTLLRSRLPENFSKGKLLRKINELEEQRRKKFFST